MCWCVCVCFVCVHLIRSRATLLAARGRSSTGAYPDAIGRLAAWSLHHGIWPLHVVIEPKPLTTEARGGCGAVGEIVGAGRHRNGAVSMPRSSTRDFRQELKSNCIGHVYGMARTAPNFTRQLQCQKWRCPVALPFEGCCMLWVNISAKVVHAISQLTLVRPTL